MQSNSYGRWRTNILVTVPAAHADEAQRRLGIAYSWVSTDPPIASFEVSFLATKKGDDESIVWQMFETLGHPDKLPWVIDWEKSDF